MTIPNSEDIMIPLLKFLKDGKNHRAADIANHLVSYFNLSEDERKQRKKSGDRLFRNRIDWARFYLRKAGLIMNPEKSQTKITSEGLKLLKQNHKKIDRGFLLRYPKFAAINNRRIRN